MTTMTPVDTIRDLLGNAALSAPSTIGQLKSWDKMVGLDVRTGDVEQQFLADPALPGFIAHDARKLFGILSRRTLLTAISQPFGREVFIKRPLRELAHKMDTRPITLKGATSISDALRHAMRRDDELRFDPILVHTGGAIALLEMHVLMIAQANLLEDALGSKGKLIEKIKMILAAHL